MAQVPDAVKRVSCFAYFNPPFGVNYALQYIVHFHQAVLDNNLAEITVAYESGWNRLTEKFYAKSEWPEAEIIAPLVNDGESPTLPPGYRALYNAVRSNIPHLIPRTVLPPCLLSHPTRHRRPIPLVRKQLRTFQLPPQCVSCSTSPFILSVSLTIAGIVRLRRTCTTGTPRTVVMGHHRRVHLPVPVVLAVAQPRQQQERG